MAEYGMMAGWLKIEMFPYETASSTPPIQDVSRYLETLQEQLKEGWTAHTAKDGRLYYCK
uniref:Uncharacterized protein n=1 Tax=Anopheles stephensi TaxID=30069 RepID=A0A182XVK8_ANOST